MPKSNGEFYYKYYYLKEFTGKMAYDELIEDEYIIKTQVEANKKTKEKER